jgi:hypothetical protein
MSNVLSFFVLIFFLLIVFSINIEGKCHTECGPACKLPPGTIGCCVICDFPYSGTNYHMFNTLIYY